MIGVPWVRLSDSSDETTFLCLPRLLLDQLAPTMLGWLFGYKKRWMRIAAEPQSFKVSSLLFKRPILEATVEYSDPPELATDMTELTPWMSSLEQPIISRSWWGGLQCTHFHWAWPLTTISPAVVNVKAFQDNVAGLRQGEYRYGQVRHKKHNFRHKTPGTGKAYVMNVPWRLLLPFDPSVLKESGPGNMGTGTPAH
jgi:hypothetical protein